MKKMIDTIIIRRSALTLFSLILFLNNIALANTSINVGPALGKKAPEISVINTLEQPINIQKLSGSKGLIILFFRSADWCPFCKYHLIEMNDYAERFTALGYGLAAISYDNSAVLAKFAKQQNIVYPLLSDQQVKTMIAYDIVNTQYKTGDDNYGIPYPGVVVINDQSKISHKHFFEGYKNRVKFSELYQQLNH